MKYPASTYGSNRRRVPVQERARGRTWWSFDAQLVVVSAGKAHVERSRGGVSAGGAGTNGCLLQVGQQTNVRNRETMFMSEQNQEKRPIEQAPTNRRHRVAA